METLDEVHILYRKALLDHHEGLQRLTSIHIGITLQLLSLILRV